MHKLAKKLKGGKVAVEEEWEAGDLVGRDCRMVDEAVHATFGAPAKIRGQKDQQVRLEVEGHFHSVLATIAQIELLPQLAPSAPNRPLVLTKAEKIELHYKFPHIDSLPAAGRLTGEHVMLGAWITNRDVGEVPGCSLIPPAVVHSYCAGLVEPGPDGEACKIKAHQFMIRRLKRSGLVGLPVWSEGEHWTLLIVRRLNQHIQVRYYDSLECVAAQNFAAAEVVLKMLCEELGQAVPQLERTNRAIQHNGVDCGAFVLHYWEGEVRRFGGQGWPLPYPWTAGPIKARKMRLVSFVAQVRKSNEQLEAEGEDPEAKGKVKKKVVVEHQPLDELENTSLSKAKLQMMKLSELAVKAKGQGLIDFYGCSRCRYNRGGCIDYKCNPHKFKAHFDKFPEKYNTTGELLLKSIALTDAELIGGGSKVSTLLHRTTFISYVILVR